MSTFGPKWPLKKGENDLYEMFESSKDKLSFELKNIIMTNPGENISDPEYGVGIRRFLFDQNITSNRSKMLNSIHQQIYRYLPGISVKDVQLSSNPNDIDSGIVGIRIVYYFAGSPLSNVFDLDIKSNL
tara:strand:+ start:56 stop:442 length:387 start_codon:yes stop_codon:yes gene_type:complete